jgi:hypothetical protein
MAGGDETLTNGEGPPGDLEKLIAKFKSGTLPAATDTIFTAVSERDVDLLLLEEVWSSVPFRTWLLEQVGYKGAGQHGLIAAWHSLSAETGESDLVMLVTDQTGRRFALMIEDKIYAPPQPRQSERYRERGDDGVKRGYWDSYLTCITAGRAYLEETPETRLYDKHVTHQAIRSWFEAEAGTSKRAEYKVAVLTAAIERSRRGYVKFEVEGVTRFLTDYWKIARNEFPELRMAKPPPGGSKSDWIYFGSPAARRRLVHKLSKGYVDLLLLGEAANLATLKVDNREILGKSIQLQTAGKSAVFRVIVEEIDNRGSAADQGDQIREGLRAALTLLEVSRTIKVRSDVSIDRPPVPDGTG